MLNIWGAKQRLCDGMARRGFLKVGALAVGGLTLADLLRLKARGAVNAGSSNKAVIMVYLNGGPSHIDLYDLKPDAPVEYRGEFKPIKTNVPGFDICELMPLQAKIADKLAIIRNVKFQQQGHSPPELYTGFLKGNRPSIGSVVSKLRADAGIRSGLPPYVYLGDANYVGQPGFLGKAHEAYIPGSKAANLGLARGMTLDRLNDRRALLRSFDVLRRDLDDAHGSMAGMDAFTAEGIGRIQRFQQRRRLLRRRPHHKRLAALQGNQRISAVQQSATPPLRQRFLRTRCQLVPDSDSWHVLPRFDSANLPKVAERAATRDFFILSLQPPGTLKRRSRL